MGTDKPTERQLEFARGWTDPRNRKAIRALARQLAYREETEDTEQAVFEKIWKAGGVPEAKSDMIYHVGDVMRHRRTDRTRSKATEKHDVHEVVDDSAPAPDSSPRPDNLAAMKQRAEAILDKARAALTGSPSRERALGVLEHALLRTNDTDVLMKALDATRPQIIEARRLAFETVEEALARRDKVEAR